MIFEAGWGYAMRPKHKVVLLGLSNTGKSRFFSHCVRRWSATDAPSFTIGAVHGTLRVRVNVKNEVCGVEPVAADDYASGFATDDTLSLWDTAGQERYNSLVTMYYRNAAVAIVMHDGDVTAGSKRRAAQLIEELRAREPETLIYLVQNKSDVQPVFDAEFAAAVGPLAGTAHTCCASENDTSVRRALVEIGELIRRRQYPPTPPAAAAQVPAATTPGRCCRVG